MKDSFFTIKKASKGLYKEKGSKFISFAFPVSSESEINSLITSLRKEYHDARHHCYAWKIGYDGCRYRVNDDGEPSGTAGKPILSQLNAKELSNILLVVIRYFGGVLLGTGGLVRAYKNAASDALENSEIIKEYIYNNYILTFNYSDINNVEKLLEEFKLIKLQEDYKENCKIKVGVRQKFEAEFLNKIKISDTIKIERTEKEKNN